MSYIQPNEEYLKSRGEKFILRTYILRQLGTTLCFIAIAPVLYLNHLSSWSLIFLFINAFIWPTIAYLYTIRQKNLIATTFRTLILDTVFGGAWIAVMGLSPLPCLLILAILISDRYAAGGGDLLKPSLIGMLIAFLITWTILGFPLYISFVPLVVWSSLPLATIYIIALSISLRYLAVSLKQRNIEFERISLMDPRLKIPNRRLFEQRLASTYIESQAKRKQSYLVLIDVDHFKNINDTFGHEVGDILLEQLSAVLCKVVGSHGIPARFGGDELAVILADFSESEVLSLAENIQHRFRYLPVLLEHQSVVTLSIGIASTKGIDSASEWFRSADSALYEVKKSGRNGIKLIRS